MHADLKHLLALQEVDRAIQAIEDEMAAFDPELENLDGAVAHLESQLEEAQRLLGEATGRREQMEGQIETSRVMQERRRQKLEWVRGAKEASALMAEIDMARGVLAKEEAEWVRSSDEVTAIETETGEAASRVETERESQVGRREEIAGLQDDCRARLAVEQKRRGKAVKDVRPPLLTVYDRSRRGRAPFAMYELHDDACGHCFTAVPMHLRQQVRRGDTVATCEVCGVIMYVAE